MSWTVDEIKKISTGKDRVRRWRTKDPKNFNPRHIFADPDVVEFYEKKVHMKKYSKSFDRARAFQSGTPAIVFCVHKCPSHGSRLYTAKLGKGNVPRGR
jgi:hypothetical protein